MVLRVQQQQQLRCLRCPRVLPAELSKAELSKVKLCTVNVTAAIIMYPLHMLSTVGMQRLSKASNTVVMAKLPVRLDSEARFRLAAMHS